MATQAEVSSLYRDYLGREPDADGLRFWQTYPGSLADVTRAFVASAANEFQNRRTRDNITPATVKAYFENNPQFSDSQIRGFMNQYAISPAELSTMLGGTDATTTAIQTRYNNSGGGLFNIDYDRLAQVLPVSAPAPAAPAPVAPAPAAPAAQPTMTTPVAPTPAPTSVPLIRGDAGQYGYANNAPILNASEVDRLLEGGVYRKLDLAHGNDLGWGTNSKYQGAMLTGAGLYGVDSPRAELDVIIRGMDQWRDLSRRGLTRAIEEKDEDGNVRNIRYEYSTGARYEDTPGDDRTGLIYQDASNLYRPPGPIYEGDPDTWVTYYGKALKYAPILEATAKQLGFAPDGLTYRQMLDGINRTDQRVAVVGRTQMWDPSKTGGIGAVEGAPHALVVYNRSGGTYTAAAQPQTFEFKDPNTSRGFFGNIANFLAEVVSIPPIAMALSAIGAPYIANTLVAQFGLSEAASKVAGQALASALVTGAATGSAEKALISAISSAGGRLAAQYSLNVGHQLGFTDPGVALTVGSTVLNAAVSGMIAKINGADVGRAMVSGAATGGLMANADRLAKLVTGGDQNVIALGRTLNLTPEEMSQVITGGIADGLIGQINGQPFTTSLVAGLVSRGVGQTAANQINQLMLDRVGEDTLRQITATTQQVATAGTRALVAGQNPVEAVNANLPSIVSTSIAVSQQTPQVVTRDVTPAAPPPPPAAPTPVAPPPTQGTGTVVDQGISPPPLAPTTVTPIAPTEPVAPPPGIPTGDGTTTTTPIAPPAAVTPPVATPPALTESETISPPTQVAEPGVIQYPTAVRPAWMPDRFVEVGRDLFYDPDTDRYFNSIAQILTGPTETAAGPARTDTGPIVITGTPLLAGDAVPAGTALPAGMRLATSDEVTRGLAGSSAQEIGGGRTAWLVPVSGSYPEPTEVPGYTAPGTNPDVNVVPGYTYQPTPGAAATRPVWMPDTFQNIAPNQWLDPSTGTVYNPQGDIVRAVEPTPPAGPPPATTPVATPTTTPTAGTPDISIPPATTDLGPTGPTTITPIAPDGTATGPVTTAPPAPVVPVDTTPVVTPTTPPAVTPPPAPPPTVTPPPPVEPPPPPPAVTPPPPVITPPPLPPVEPPYVPPYVPPTPPPSPPTPTPYVPPQVDPLYLAPLVNPGVNPGFVLGAVRPAYQTTQPYQQQYYYGPQPYFRVMEDLANYNVIPGGLPPAYQQPVPYYAQPAAYQLPTYAPDMTLIQPTTGVRR